MGREEEMVNHIKEAANRRFLESREQIWSYYRKHRDEVAGGILTVFKSLFRQAVTVQSEGRKGAIRYICIFHLNSSIVAGSYQYMFSLFEAVFYLDQEDVSACYIPQFILSFIKVDIDYLESELKKNYVRLRQYELDKVVFLYMQNYQELMKGIFTDIMTDIVGLAEYGEIVKFGNPLFLYGGYRDKAIRLDGIDKAIRQDEMDKAIRLDEMDKTIRLDGMEEESEILHDRGRIKKPTA